MQMYLIRNICIKKDMHTEKSICEDTHYIKKVELYNYFSIMAFYDINNLAQL